ncbi:MAG: alpha-ketoglutarate-dependent dioxygenase AlkB [Mizugakiibacter sp.]|uniref:alpha-ketoglutarate-dependent dioxygenase AlkB family protein n=1 Tax=Mizugakiibacter sp. TaxID=1972610 RepID=UPI0031C43218|nr:alpha-ketoglutarate-dependent dioxygenase AlkB [Xanthomonadaceae bacterium]
MPEHIALPRWQALDLPGADVRLAPGWLARAEADALFAELVDAIAWERHRVRIFGREFDAPRLSCWIGDPEAAYTYSKVRFEPRPWPPALAALRARVGEACGETFNGVLANLYRDGADSMGWHGDDERELGPAPVIASLSLGAVRRFRLRHRRDASIALALELPHGSLLRMAGATQRLYRHDLPKTRAAVGPRLNLTFRRILLA